MEAGVDPRDRRGLLGLGDHDRAVVGLGEGCEVGREGGGARSAHPHDHAVGVERGFDDGATREDLGVSRDGVLEIEDDGIRARERLLESLGPIGGAEQEGGAMVEDAHARVPPSSSGA
jgi:hypothetical protein